MTTLSARPAESAWNKVPQVVLFFWVIKILSTTVGETAADLLNVKLSLGTGGVAVLMSTALAAALFAQLRAPRYVPVRYWTTVVLVSVVGTLLTDLLTDNVGVPLPVSTGGFALALLLTFGVWYADQGTLSIQTIDTRRRELYYWLAVLMTFALGTAAGDLLAEQMQVGYGPSALLFAAAIALVALAHYRFKVNALLSFWLVYVLTRPLGASCGDYLSQPVADGGLGFGVVQTSVIFFVVISALVAYLTFTRADVSEARNPS